MGGSKSVLGSESSRCPSGGMLVLCPTPPSDALLHLIQSWEQKHESVLLCFCDPEESMEQTLFDPEVGEEVIAEVRRLPACERIDVILESRGGQASVAYQLATFLRAKCTVLRVLVPVRAKSAATLFCLAADHIAMAETAELGPVDTQLWDPERPGPMRSALEDFQAVEYLRGLSLNMVSVFAQVLTEQYGLAMADALKRAAKYAAATTRPLFEQVDPMDAARSHRAVEVVREYGSRLMTRYAYKDDPTENVQRLLDRLVRRYPDHGFVIDRQEAAEIGLRVTQMEEEDAADILALRSVSGRLVGFLPAEARLGLNITAPSVETDKVDQKEGASHGAVAAGDPAPKPPGAGTRPVGSPDTDPVDGDGGSPEESP